jgi:hypothetical protein
MQVSQVAQDLYEAMPKVCWMTEKNLAKLVRIRASRIKYLKKELEEARLIKIKFGHNGKRGNPRHEITKLPKNGSPICKHIKNVFALGDWQFLDRNLMIECYLKAKWDILPFAPNSKHPIKGLNTHKWRKRTAAEKFEFFFDNNDLNVGLKICSHLTIVDVDVKENDWLENKNFRNTLSVSTPRGFHFYFRKDSIITTSAKIIPDIDTRCKNSFILLPPSKLFPDKSYEWRNVAMPEYLPINFRRKWREKEFERRSTSGKFSIGDEITEGSRNDSLWRHGRSLKQQGNNLYEIEEIMREKNRSNCIPPLPAKELDILINNVWNRSDKSEFLSKKQS